MATLLKERARKPLVENMGCYASESFKDGAPHFRLTLFGGTSPDYTIELSRVEMLSIASEWIRSEAHNAIRKEKAKRKALEADART